jgi:hypothetical protein
MPWKQQERARGAGAFHSGEAVLGDQWMVEPRVFVSKELESCKEERSVDVVWDKLGMNP